MLFRSYRSLACVGMGSALVIVITAKSSGALMALMAAVAALTFWKWRAFLPWVRWGVVLGILLLASVMKAPVWYWFDRLSSVTGGTGWHRAFLIDQTIRYFDEWWLFGTTYTAHWGPGGEVTTGDPNMMDITNHYVMEGVKGGLARLALFLGIVVRCFRSFGRHLRVETHDPSTQFFIWGTGVALFTHCVSFLSITYFDQIVVVWYWLLAFASYVDRANSRVATPLDETKGDLNPVKREPVPVDI